MSLTFEKLFSLKDELPSNKFIFPAHISLGAAVKI